MGFVYCFNPHPHAEGDTLGVRHVYALSVSIHTLTRRVTLSRLVPLLSMFSFNPHPHAEGDLSLTKIMLTTTRFNPHPHAEGDVLYPQRLFPHFRFNPHPHAEGDFYRLTLLSEFCSFNPHPHAEGDLNDLLSSRRIPVSIHTLTRRVTLVTKNNLFTSK